MLFDCYMEIGSYNKAEEILKKLENPKDYNYLIRISRWSDYKGQLSAAIRYMERAIKIAESRNSVSLKIWTYSNIADYYGHDGNIRASYNYFIKTLKLQPDNAYAKKGIAWILFSKEHNIPEANRILDRLIPYHKVPDYYLLKAEMAHYDGQDDAAEKHMQQFLTLVDMPLYGNMYNSYKIEVLVESDPERALILAKEEIKNRATPETYHLLALAQLANDKEEKALETIQKYVEGKTSEPMALVHSAMVYKANGMDEKVAILKKYLLAASYEIGPVITAEVANL
jgi:Tfp pilus assembly protein PilF